MTARALLERLEAADVIIWRSADGELYHDTRAGAITGALLADVHAQYAALASLLARVPCRVGYVRGATAWHALLARSGVLVWACRLWYAPPAHAVVARRSALPPASPRDRLCGHCVAELVRRELDLLNAVPPRTEPV